MPRDEDAMREEEAIREEDAHMHATKREKSSNIPVLPIFQKGCYKTKPLFIDTITT